jgi:hypothetical protein
MSAIATEGTGGIYFISTDTANYCDDLFFAVVVFLELVDSIERGFVLRS